MLLLTLEFERAVDFLARKSVGVGGSGGHDLVGGVGAEMTFGGGGAQAFGADPAYVDSSFIDALHIAIALFQYGVLRTESSVVGAGLAAAGGGAGEAYISGGGPGYEYVLSPKSKHGASSGGLLVDDDAAPGEAVLRFAVMLRKYILYLASESRAAFAESKAAKGQEQIDAAAVSILMARTAVEYAVVLRAAKPSSATQAEHTAREQQLQEILVDLILSLEAGSPALQDLLWGTKQGEWEAWRQSTAYMPQKSTPGGTEGHLHNSLMNSPGAPTCIDSILRAAAAEAKKMALFPL